MIETVVVTPDMQQTATRFLAGREHRKANVRLAVARFSDGCEMDLCVNGGREPWFEGILYTAEGHELGGTEPYDDLLREFTVRAQDRTYTTNLSKGET
jgi:hypothetical protein